MKNIAIHHTAVVRTSTPQLNAVNRYHKGKWNMKSRLGYYVGYNYFIDVDGTVTQTRAWTEETIANVGHNCDTPARCDTISICLADNYNTTPYIADAQSDSLDGLIADIKKHHPKIEVVGHRDLQTSRTCPGANINAFNFTHWNNIQSNDSDDSEKQKEIEALQKRLDRLLAILQNLLKSLRK
jgi:N-acetyl-anhydromuramyl-L-alanine amidase AmpD